MCIATKGNDRSHSNSNAVMKQPKLQQRQQLHVSTSSPQHKRSKVAQACEQLRRNDPTLTLLNLNQQELGNEGALDLADALSYNTRLVVLFIDNNNIYGKGAAALANSFANHPSLTYVMMSYNPIGDIGASAMSVALIVNSKIQRLKLDSCQIGVNGAKSLAVAIQRNQTLKKLVLDDNPIRTEGALAIIQDGLGKNTSLESLSMEHCDTISQKNRILSKVRDVLKLTNKTLEELALDYETDSPYCDKKIVQEVRHYLDLNRAGGRFFGDIEIPTNLWPRILSKVRHNPNMLYYSLCQRPEIFCKNNRNNNHHTAIHESSEDKKVVTSGLLQENCAVNKRRKVEK